jgi:hypothetical protein
MDAHFRSGFYLGNGVMHMILSLMPGKPHIVAGLLGYQGDRQVALMFCHCLGVGRKMGWSQLFPSVRLTFIIYYSTFVHLYVSSEDEGIRRTICDIVLLIFHLALSSFTFDGVDIDGAEDLGQEFKA